MAQDSKESGQKNKHVFALYAGTDATKWAELAGQKITHSQLGRGVIVCLGRGNGGTILIANFGSTTRHFPIPSFANDPLIRSISLSPGIVLRVQSFMEQYEADQAEQRKREQLQANHRRTYRSPYINHCWKCKRTIDSDNDDRCLRCKFFICGNCKACMCNKDYSY